MASAREATPATGRSPATGSKYDMFIQINGIKGDSTDDAHKDWIAVLNFEHSIVQPQGGDPSAQGVLTGGKAAHSDFTIGKRVDSASPILAQYVCSGQNIMDAKFEICRAMGEKTTFMVYEFKNFIISSVSPSGSASADDPVPVEEFTIRYGEITWSYTPTVITGGGKKKAAINAGWSTWQNKKL